MENKISKLKKILQEDEFRRALFINHIAAGVEHNNLLRYLSDIKIRTIIDIGANRGQFALAARHHFPKASIHSFEPLKEPAEVYRRAFAQDQLTRLYECAIGSAEKATIIHVSKADDSSSLLPISDLQNELYPGTSEKETRLIIEKPLDVVLSASDIQGPALLKIDVQGFEKQVLEGCKSLLPLFSYIYVECSFIELYSGQALAHEIITFLSENGFYLSGIYNLSYDKKGVAVQGDFLFTRTVRKN